MKTDNKIQLLDTAYSTFLNIMLADFPLEQLGSVTVDDVMGYGTAMDEKIQNLQDRINLAILQKEQSAELNFSFETFPVFKKMMNNETTAIIVDELQVSMLIDETKVEFLLRLSTVLDFIDGDWKVVHWHGSKPEYNSEGTDTCHKDEWTQKQAELEKQVQEKTTELIEKNRELEIEAALERVRSCSNTMQKSEELLKVVQQLDKEIIALGIEVHGSQIITDFINPERSSNCWFAIEGKNFLGKFHIPFLDHPITTRVNNAFLKDIQYYSDKYSKTQKNKYFNLLFKYSDFKNIPKERQEFILSTPGITRTTILNENSILIFHRYNLIDFNSDEEEIFKRFGKVFEQAYTRFLDLQKAEAQAREAQIETALERVRSRSMAMHKSDELQEVIMCVFNELNQLDVSMKVSMINIPEKDTFDYHLWIANEDKTYAQQIYAPFFDDEINNEYYDSVKKRERLYSGTFPKKIKDRWFDFLFEYSDFKDSPLKRKEYLYNSSGYSVSVAINKHSHILIIKYKEEPFSKEENETLIKFANVFEQSYTRFLDLKKAEKQAKEAQIEAALERVRSKSLSMHQSYQLLEVIREVFIQLQKLDLYVDMCCMDILDSTSDDLNIWVVTVGDDYPQKVRIPINNSVVLQDYVKAKKSQINFLVSNYSKRDKDIFFEYAFAHSDLRNAPGKRKKLIKQSSSFTRTVTISQHFSIWMVNYQNLPYTDQENKILKRFTKVFEQSYTRFLDLQKAEEQAREAQIEAALERVRARSMAMHQSEELAESAKMLFQQLELLQIPIFSAGYVIWNDNKKQSASFWMSSEGMLQPPFSVPLDTDSIFKKYKSEGLKGTKFYADKYNGKRLAKHYENIVALPEIQSMIQNMPELGLQMPNFPKYQVNNVAYFKQGFLLFSTYEHIPESHKILKRFAKVFEQTYTRFLDLQKAEAQAREARIETALEKVRSRSLAMHSGNELGDIVTLIVEKLKDLDVVLDANGVVLCTYFNDSKDVVHWIASPDFTIAGSYFLPYFDHPIFNDAWHSKESGDEYFSKAFSVEEKNSFFDYAFEHSDYKNFPDDFKEWVFQNDQHILSFAWQKKSAILIPSHTGVLPSVEDVEILKRFARVFEQTYTRFLDLQKAEAQAHEAQIEAALERIRTQAMAMQHSDDLKKSALIIFNEFEKLNLSVQRCGIGIINQENWDCEIWSTVVTPDGKKEIATGTLSLLIHPMLKGTLEAWKKHESFFYILEGQELVEYYKMVKESGFHLPEDIIEKASSMARQFYYNALYGAGGLYVISNTEPSNNEKYIISRFAEVFHLTYTRYEDLQKAEARALEAIKQASLDRVRGEIASMRTKDDLNRITPLIWKELIALDVPFIRCGVFIMDEVNRNINTFLSTPNGDSIAAFHLPYDTPGNFADIINHWKQQKNYIHHWDIIEFINLADVLLKNGSIATREQYLSSMPSEGIYLNFLPFLQGMLYVGNTSPLAQDILQLLKSLAESFSIAYARYEDFKLLEEAKNKVEHTLSELKSAQTQLVHSEKMASLGELTAGIAHEIQNPLNFVNNFSEISSELMAEMDEELNAGDIEEVKAITSDIKQNLDKINHHGKRASSIVKGMLQHSRTSSGQKEFTNINVLADECLRLSYHGLRAKDKSFNADFKTEFDNSLPKLNMVPQDIGRVLLNLINNAFYAASSKALAMEDKDYKPIIVVSTKKLKNKIKITVKDNGPGIPSEIKDKIFQPFFTTKPTGSGTGLGLSLSYDIVKAHEGELSVESNEKEGSVFIIQLPLKSS